uniref:Uncharacterized protein n=1 Tax=Brassica oleracea TaxID=3712 RepID=A0A3P6GIT4_BRAOL|nr:unnamed protein product [Brassica oleracea]
MLPMITGFMNWSTNPTSCKVYWSGFHDYLIPHKSFTCNYSISL